MKLIGVLAVAAFAVLASPRSFSSEQDTDPSDALDIVAKNKPQPSPKAAGDHDRAAFDHASGTSKDAMLSHSERPSRSPSSDHDYMNSALLLFYYIGEII
ncbi:MAG TPA: hypothetical protein VLM79_32500 [Kofleriaceae bacterium]|nr:hypothetical protein [Kofleriaceae bacterium]